MGRRVALVRRPGCQSRQARAISGHHVDVAIATDVAVEGELRSIGRPGRIGVLPICSAKPSKGAAVAIDDVDVSQSAGSSAGKCDLRSIGRPRGRAVVQAPFPPLTGVRQARLGPAVGVRHADGDIAADIGDPFELRDSSQYEAARRPTKMSGPPCHEGAPTMDGRDEERLVRRTPRPNRATAHRVIPRSLCR
jgi:hypothetical protein